MGIFRKIGEFLGVVKKTPPPTPEPKETGKVSIRKPVSFKKSEDSQLGHEEFRTLDDAVDYAQNLSGQKILIMAYGQLSRPNDYNNPIGWGALSPGYATNRLVGQPAYKVRLENRQHDIFIQVTKYHVVHEEM